ncbi:MAG: hypothetical protein FGM46_01765 [Ferruginibacter sp.]|nr:hypothetical protein [Ferruginibacter sp.]
MKKLMLCFAFYLISVALVAQNNLSRKNTFSVDLNKESPAIIASADLYNLKINNSEPFVNTNYLKTKKNSPNRDFCDNITEIILAMKDGNMVEYAAEIESKNDKIIRYKSSKNLSSLIDENYVVYNKKDKNYVFWAIQNCDDEEDLKSTTEYYLTFFEDCYILKNNENSSEKNEYGLTEYFYAINNYKCSISLNPEKTDEGTFVLYIYLIPD